MKILCIGYYDKFSRFFLGIEKELKTHYTSIQFSILSLFFSGFFYAGLRGKSSSWLTQKALFKVFNNKRKYNRILESGAVYKNLNLNELINYHFKLNPKTSRKKLLLQAVAYIDIIDEKLREDPDFLMLIGDLRLPVEIARRLAEQYHIKTFFIEQGPFKTTIFDEKGVNANHSIRGFQPAHNQNIPTKKWKKPGSTSPQPKKYSRSPFYRGMDYALEFLLQKTPVYPPDLKMNQALFSRFTFSDAVQKNIEFLPKKTHAKSIFLLVCQVPFDVNMTHHSPHFSNHFEILKAVYENLPENALLVVREHPIYRGKYSTAFYDFIIENQIQVDFQKSAAPVMKAADVVVVNNSTVGLEAISQYKKTLVMGDAYYDSSDLCLKLDERENLKRLLKQSLEFKVNPEKVNSFMQEFTENHLLEGFITDKHLKSPKAIAEKLIKLHAKNS